MLGLGCLLLRGLVGGLIASLRRYTYLPGRDTAGSSRSGRLRADFFAVLCLYLARGCISLVRVPASSLDQATTDQFTDPIERRTIRQSFEFNRRPCLFPAGSNACPTERHPYQRHRQTQTRHPHPPPPLSPTPHRDNLSTCARAQTHKPDENSGIRIWRTARAPMAEFRAR